MNSGGKVTEVHKDGSKYAFDSDYYHEHFIIGTVVISVPPAASATTTTSTITITSNLSTFSRRN